MLNIDGQMTTIQRDIATRHTQSRSPRITRHDPAPRDTVQLSGAAEAAAADEVRLRTGLIDRIRREIESGTYITTEKLDIAAEQLHRYLRTARD